MKTIKTSYSTPLKCVYRISQGLAVFIINIHNFASIAEKKQKKQDGSFNTNRFVISGSLKQNVLTNLS